MTSTTGLYRELYRHWERLAENRLQTLRGERGKREHLGTRLAIMITSWHDPYQLKRPLPWNYLQSLRVNDHVAPQPRPQGFSLKKWLVAPLWSFFTLLESNFPTKKERKWRKFLYVYGENREIRDRKIEVFRHFPRTANVKKSRDKGLSVRFAVQGSRLYA